MINKLKKLRLAQWYIIEYYHYDLVKINNWINKAVSLNLQDDVVLFLIESLSSWVDFYTHLPSSYEDYKDYDDMTEEYLAGENIFHV